MYLEKDLLVDIHDWCFVSGKVNVLESSLFTQQYFEKLMEMNTVDDIFKYIINSKLKDYFTSKENIYAFEQSLDAYFFDYINEIRLLSPITVVCDLFLLRYKFLDLKTFLKNRLIGIPHELISFYILKSSDMEHLWSKKEKVPITGLEVDLFSPEPLPDSLEVLLNGVNNLKKALRENKEFSKNNTLWVIDLIMDNAYLCHLSNISEQISTQYIKEYLEKFIFINVIGSLARAVFTRCNTELLRKYFLQDYLNKTHFLNLLDLPIADWKEILKKELPAEIVNNVISDKVEKDRSKLNLMRCEKLLANYLLDTIKLAKYITFGPERVFGYLCGLDVETYNLKLVIGGKINKIERQLLKDRLRNCYV
ncbi:MAG: V-type ATPase subunit [Candidatus Scalinduaceae bacterium]